MTDYRKKPVVIQAALFDGNLVGDPDLTNPGCVKPFTCPDWFPAVNRYTGVLNPTVAAGEVLFNQHNDLFIGTLEGTLKASPGDWIIRGVQGEIYPCKPEIFAATYEAI